MLRIALALPLALAALCVPAAAAAEPPALCKALKALAAESRRSGEPQRISAIVGAPGAFLACRPDTQGPAAQAFCDAAAAAADPGAPHAFPWRIHACVDTLAAEPRLTTSDEPAGFGRKKVLTRLAASLGGGARLDVSYAAAPGTAGGRYSLVVWVPK